MATETQAPAKASSAVPPWHIETILRLGDDSLVLAQRASEWAGHGPVLEEDLAMANNSLSQGAGTESLHWKEIKDLLTPPS